MEFTKTLSLGLKTGVQLERCTNTKKGLRQNRYKFSDDAEKYTLNSVVQVLLKRITLQLSFYSKAKWLCDVNEIIRTNKSIPSIADSLGYRKKELFWVFMWRGKDRLIRVIICKVFMDGKKIRNNRFLENKSSGSLFISKNNNGKAIKPDRETAKGTLYYDEKRPDNAFE